MTENIIELIDNWAKENPSQVAYDYLGEEKTYGDLKYASDAIAANLQEMNLKKGPVLIFGGQKFETVATFLGAVKAGHAYIPVDNHSPKERLEVIIKIANPVAIIALEDLEDINFKGAIIDAKKIAMFIASGKTLSNKNYVNGDDNFYIIFTSGTTGMPKGVQISHDNLASFSDWIEKDFPLGNFSANLVQAPYSFDLSVMSLYPILLMGGKISVLPKDIAENFKELFSKLPKMKLTEWVSTPSFADVCLLNPDFNEQNLPELKRFIFCGEELTHTTAQKLHERFKNAKIFNTYGPTEATVAITSVEITQKILNYYPRLPIGKVKEDSQLVLVDEDLNEVSKGQVGEILLMGPSVFKGYMNNPEKTKQALVEFDGKKAYRTGDLGQFDDNGQLLYKGRIDFQIKLHGFRIELEDIDHHLDRVSLVKQAITIPKYDKNHKVSQVLAYIVPENNEFETDFKLTQAIKQELNKTMMSYMMPQRFVYVDSLPMTQNGKIDRKSLIKEVNND